MISAPVKKILLGIFDSEKTLLTAAKNFREKGVKFFDIYTPYPVHGLDHAMGLAPSRLPQFTFAAGALGLLVAILLQYYVNLISWPMNIGGKPNNAWPAFVPVCFELTVLFGGVLTFLAFLARCKLFPGKRPVVSVPRLTDDRFVIVFATGEKDFKLEETVSLLKQNGAMEIMENEVPA